MPVPVSVLPGFAELAPQLHQRSWGSTPCRPSPRPWCFAPGGGTENGSCRQYLHPHGQLPEPQGAGPGSAGPGQRLRRPPEPLPLGDAAAVTLQLGPGVVQGLLAAVAGVHLPDSDQQSFLVHISRPAWGLTCQPLLLLGTSPDRGLTHRDAERVCHMLGTSPPRNLTSWRPWLLISLTWDFTYWAPLLPRIWALGL